MKSLQLTPSSLHKAFIICQPGLEFQILREVKETWPCLMGGDAQPNLNPTPEFKIQEGGVELSSELTHLLQLNFFLKSATRVLLRLAEFRCRDLPKLYARIQGIEWSRLLASRNYEIEAAASGSRLNNEKRIVATMREAIDACFPSGTLVKKSAIGINNPQIYVRVFEDLVTVSLDTSGEPLYKRGWGTHKTEAPLRETLAHFMLAQMLEGLSEAEVSAIKLVDPMCGSGTLLLEAATYYRPIFERSFAFKQFLFCPKLFHTANWEANYKRLPKTTLFSKLQGLDVSGDVMAVAQRNAEAMGVDCEWTVEDLFAKNFRKTPSEVCWVICNPPYGMRLSQNEGAGGASKKVEQGYLERWISAVAVKYSPQKIGFVYPKNRITKDWQPPGGWRIQSRTLFRNGGTPVAFVILQSGVA